MAAAYKTAWKQEHPDADDDFVGFRAEIDPETGDMRMFQQVLEEVDTADGEGVEMKVLSEEEVDRHRGLPRADRRADGEAGDLPEAPRRRAGDDLRGVRRPRGRRRHRHRPAVRAPLHAARPRQGRGAVAAGRAGALRAVPQRRAPEGLHHRGPPGRQGSADRGQPHPPRAARSGCSRWRCPRSRTAWSRSVASRASPATARRSRSGPTSPRSTRSARASGRRARACATSSPSCAARRSTSCRGPTTRASWWRTPCSPRR